MKIEKVNVYLVSIPLPKPFFPCWVPNYPQTHNNFYLLELLADGLKGYAATPRFINEKDSSLKVAIPMIIGMDVEDNKIYALLEALHLLGINLFWIDAALWDLKAKAKGISLFKYLGGKEEYIMAYASTGEIKEANKMVEEVERLVSIGFKAVKLRAHRKNINDDIEVVRRVREEFSDIRLMVDANQGWEMSVFEKGPIWELKDAYYFVRAVEDLNIYWLEEPLYRFDYENLSALKKLTTIPLAGGEFNFGISQFKEFVNHRSLDILQPDATLSGGVKNSIEVAKLCEKSYISFSPHTWTNGVGLLINLNCLGAYSGEKMIEYPIDTSSWVPEARDGILKEIVKIDKDGNVKIPESIEIDEEKLKKFGQKII